MPWNSVFSPQGLGEGKKQKLERIFHIAYLFAEMLLKVIIVHMDVIWQSKALKQLKKIGDRSLQERLLSAARGLSEFPNCSNLKALSNHDYSYRLRVGDWRLLFNAYEEINIISIEEVKKRDERTY